MKKRKKLQIIELVGLPGCDKTIFAPALRDKLEEVGFKVMFLSEESINAAMCKKRNHLMLGRHGGFELRLHLKAFAKSFEGDNEKRLSDACRAYYIFSHYVKESEKNTDYDILLAEKGFIQTLLSIIHLQPVNMQKRARIARILKRIESKGIEYASITCRTNTELAYNRIVESSEKPEEIDEKKLRQDLEKFAMAKEQVYNVALDNLKLTNIFADSQKSLEENTDYLAKFISEIFDIG